MRYTACVVKAKTMQPDVNDDMEGGDYVQDIPSPPTKKRKVKDTSSQSRSGQNKANAEVKASMKSKVSKKNGRQSAKLSASQNASTELEEFTLPQQLDDAPKKNASCMIM